MWRLLLKIASYLLAAFFSLLFYVVVVDLVSLTRDDNKLLADLKLRVSAVQEFKERVGRLPEEAELPQLFAAIPKSGPGYTFHVSTFEVPMPRHRNGREIVWPATGGWAVWVWLGECSEFYTSWDSRYSPSEPFSWLEVEGWLLFSPFFAILFFLLPHLAGRLQRGQTPRANVDLAAGPS